MGFKADLGILSIKIFAQKRFNAPRSIRLPQKCSGTYRSTYCVKMHLKLDRIKELGTLVHTYHTYIYIIVSADVLLEF